MKSFNEEGNLKGGKDEILERWTGHFSELLGNRTMETMINREITKYDGEQQFLPEIEEIITEINLLKKNKAPGESGITAEMLKNGGENLQLVIANMIQDIWLREEMPEDWKTAIFYPIHKKGDRTRCENYRGIASTT